MHASLAAGFEFSKGKVILLDTFSDNIISPTCQKLLDRSVIFSLYMIFLLCIYEEKTNKNDWSQSNMHAYLCNCLLLSNADHILHALL